MTSMSGYVTYLNYVAGTTKGTVTQGDVFNGVFSLAQEGNSNAEYTSDRVTATLNAGTGNILAWTPVVHESFTNNNTKYDAKVTGTNGTVTYVYVKDADNKLYTNSTYANEYNATQGDVVAYVYNNEVVPQNDLPILNAKVESMPLLAKARRIAIYYK